MGREVAEMLDFSGFDDMGYDKWVGMRKLGFCLILWEILKISTRENFEESLWMNQL